MTAPAHLGAFSLRNNGALSRTWALSDSAYVDLHRLMSLSSSTPASDHARWCAAAGLEPGRVATVPVPSKRALVRMMRRRGPTGSYRVDAISDHLEQWERLRIARWHRKVLFLFPEHLVAAEDHASRDERRVETPTPPGWWSDEDPGVGSPGEGVAQAQAELPLCGSGSEGERSDIDRPGDRHPIGSLLYRDLVCVPPQPPQGGAGNTEIERLCLQAYPVRAGETPRARLCANSRATIAALVEEYGEERVLEEARQLLDLDHPVQVLVRRLRRARVLEASGADPGVQQQTTAAIEAAGRRERVREAREQGRRPQASGLPASERQARRKARRAKREAEALATYRAALAVSLCADQRLEAFKAGQAEGCEAAPSPAGVRCPAASVEPGGAVCQGSPAPAAPTVTVGAETVGDAARSAAPAPSAPSADPAAAAVWAGRRERVRQQVTAENWETYFALLVPIRLDGETVVLGASDPFFGDWCRLHYGALLAQAGARIDGCGDGCADFEQTWRAVQVAEVQRDRTRAEAEEARAEAGRVVDLVRAVARMGLAS